MNLRSTAKHALRRSWTALQPPIRRKLVRGMLATMSDDDKFAAGIPTVGGLLGNIRAGGFVPRTVVDVGARVGNWTRMSAAIFPSARFFMFDADPDNEPALRDSRARVGNRAE